MDRLSDLGRRDVINVVDGRRLGYVIDLEVETTKGCIRSIILPGRPRFFGLLGRERDLFIPWKSIVKIGEDVILVELWEGEGPPTSRPWRFRRYEDDDPKVS